MSQDHINKCEGLVCHHGFVFGFSIPQQVFLCLGMVLQPFLLIGRSYSPSGHVGFLACLRQMLAY